LDAAPLDFLELPTTLGQGFQEIRLSGNKAFREDDFGLYEENVALSIF
jgi:hypothetical protein